MHDKKDEKDEKEWADLETCRISTDQKGNKSMLRVGFEFFACGGPKPHELESCPLDHSGIVALSDQQARCRFPLKWEARLLTGYRGARRSRKCDFGLKTPSALLIRNPIHVLNPKSLSSPNSDSRPRPKISIFPADPKSD